MLDCGREEVERFAEGERYGERYGAGGIDIGAN